MSFWAKLYLPVSDNKRIAAVGLVLTVFGTVWTVGIDTFTLFRPGPVVTTAANSERTADASECLVQEAAGLREDVEEGFQATVVATESLSEATSQVKR